MRFGIPVFGTRIAPRCTIADGMLVVVVQGTRVTERHQVPLEQSNWQEILPLVQRFRIDTVVCGGIARGEKALLDGLRVAVVENVACTTDEVVAAIVAGCLRPGLGFCADDDRPAELRQEPSNGCRAGELEPACVLDCLACEDRVCLRGQSCHPGIAGISKPRSDACNETMLESARDVALEDERILCRLSELIYFSLEMKFRRIGLAYCVELTDAARILAHVLMRLFEVVPVCCKVGGVVPEDALEARNRRSEHGCEAEVACNPQVQAGALERAGCDLIVLVGLCLGVDCVFARSTEIPVTTLFVKDKSLANNPIGAIYSDYYLKEAIRSATMDRERSPK